MYAKKLYSILILLMLLVCNAFAEPIITIPDTTINRGTIYRIPVYGSFSNVESKSLELVFEFNQFVIDIKNAEIDANSILNGKSISISQNLSQAHAICRVTIDPTNINLQNGKLFDLLIQGLVSNDSLCDFKCSEVIIDKKNVSFTSNSSTIKVLGESIFQAYPEGLFQNFPNPFRGSTTFQFNLANESGIEFELYNYFGTRLYNFDEFCRYIKIFNVSKENGTKPVENYKAVLSKGKYYMQFNVDENVFPSGMFILTMKANNQFFSKSFIYLK